MKKADIYLGTYATCYKVDVLLSWNYKHLSNLETKHKVASINIKEGYYKELELTTPYEVLSDEN